MDTLYMIEKLSFYFWELSIIIKTNGVHCTYFVHNGNIELVFLGGKYKNQNLWHALQLTKC